MIIAQGAKIPNLPRKVWTRIFPRGKAGIWNRAAAMFDSLDGFGISGTWRTGTILKLGNQTVIDDRADLGFGLCWAIFRNNFKTIEHSPWKILLSFSRN